MRQLPFKTEPKRRTRQVGTEELGTLEFPVFGSLLVGERIAINDRAFTGALSTEISSFSALLRAGESLGQDDADLLAVRLMSHLLGIKVDLTERERRLRQQYAESLEAANLKLGPIWEQQVVRTVTALIRFRLAGCEDWTDADTEDLPLAMQAAIFSFAQDEQFGENAAKAADQQIGELLESLGKIGEALHQKGPPTRGAAPTGAAETSGPTRPSSQQSGSHSKRKPSSTRRSRKGSDS